MTDYFRKYLEVAPLALAIWRSLEANAVSKWRLRRPILDIGCGFGEFGGVFFDSFIEVGIDISASDLALAAQKRKYKKLTLADARNLPFKSSSFRSIISISSLEHIKGVEKVFFEAYRVLEPGSLFIFTVHTTTLNKLLFMPFARNFWMRQYHKLFKHEINTTKEEWLKMAKNAGFKIINCQGIISKLQLMLFELALPTAVPSQIFRKLFKKRMFFTLPIRTEIVYHLFKWVLNDSKMTNANIIVVVQKPV